MIEMEKKIALQKKESININVDEFMRKLNDKIEASKTNRQIFFTSSAMVFIILLLIVTQFGAPDFELDNYMPSRTENLIETDFWNINIDSIKNEQEYFNNMAYFFLDEGYTWEVVELLDQFKLIEEEPL
tara:strand:+ start:1360 stop:1746 length:387 start_codon:yes stop_codon:yes gene_type:complete